jgi:glycine/D-amino acid oxidase-like deaminating enzyme
MFDAPWSGKASAAAAGVVHVITGKFATKHPEAETLLAALHQFFAKPRFSGLRRWLELRLVYRPYATIEQLNGWAKRLAEPAYQAFVAEYDPYLPDRLHNPYGGLAIAQGGRLDVPLFLEELYVVLSRTGRFVRIPVWLPYEAIDPIRKQVRIPDQVIDYAALIFCDGAKAQHNPFYATNQIQPLKGELLRLTGLKLPADMPIFIKKHYLVPPTVVQPEVWQLGATTEKQFLSELPTLAARQELLEHLTTDVLRNPAGSIEVIDHLAGIRPTTHTRKAFVESHPEFDTIYRFNGLGTKGVLQAPWLAQQLAGRLNAALPPSGC